VNFDIVGLISYWKAPSDIEVSRGAPIRSETIDGINTEYMGSRE